MFFRILGNRRARGATLVETALTLPIFLGLIFIYIWIAVMLNARAAVSSALAQGVHLAFLRSQDQTLSGPLLTAINSVATGGSMDPLTSVLCLNVDDADCKDSYKNETLGHLFSGDMTQVPAKYWYVLVYVNEAIRQAMGNMVRFPCNPDPDNYLGNDFYDSAAVSGPGCFACRFLSPDTGNLVPPSGGVIPVPVDPNSLSEDPATNPAVLAEKTIAIQCEYQPDATIARPIQGLLNITGLAHNIVSASMSYSADNLANSQAFF